MVRKSTSTRRSTRVVAEPIEPIVKSKNSRTWRLGEVRDRRRMLLPAKTITFMFFAMVIFIIAFGILYQNTEGQRQSIQERDSQLKKTESYEELYRQRKTSTNTGILQGD